MQGIYAISDACTGKLYVGKADGSERILGRWTTYAQDGHGGNKALKLLDIEDPSNKHNFVFSILRVFDPNAPATEVNAAESHFMKALMTREFGLNCLGARDPSPGSLHRVGLTRPPEPPLASCDPARHR